MVFGIFKMLGYRFSPRFKDLEDQRFWKAQMPGAEAAGGYGPLEAIARNKVNVKKVITHWPDMLRVAGSLVTNQVRAYDLLRMFGREGHPTPLGQAFAEYGRIAKTLHLLAVVDPMDDTYRRQMHKQLTVQESRHKLAREICHGKKGTIHQAYRDGMEDLLTELPKGELERPRSSTHGDEIGLPAQPTPREAVPYNRPDVLSSRVVGDHSGSWRIRCRSVRSYGMSRRLPCRGSAGSRRPATQPCRSGCSTGTASRWRRSASSCSTCSLTTTARLRSARTRTSCWPGSGFCGPSMCRGTGQAVQRPGTSRCG